VTGIIERAARLVARRTVQLDEQHDVLDHSSPSLTSSKMNSGSLKT
jgi:hypothetical protein